MEKARIDKILSNEEIRTIITAIGTGIEEEFTAVDQLVHAIRNIRAEMQIPPSAASSLILIASEEQIQAALRISGKACKCGVPHPVRYYLGPEPTGWLCAGCGHGYAPWVPECHHCPAPPALEIDGCP